MLAGSVASMTVLGAPDLIVLSLTEFADQARRICRASDLPLIVDADHGYGNALNVARTVQELETAGVAALSIEDTILPRPYGADGTASLVSIDEGIGKLRAALDARRDPDLVIIGRTSAPATNGIADAVARVDAYQDAGVDMIMLIGVKTRADLETIASRVRIPIMLGGAGDALRDVDYLASLGVRVCLTGHQPFMAAMQAVYDALKALRSGVNPAEVAVNVDAAMIRNTTRDDDYRRSIERYLGAG